MCSRCTRARTKRPTIRRTFPTDCRPPRIRASMPRAIWRLASAFRPFLRARPLDFMVVGSRARRVDAVRRFHPDAIWSTYPIATAHAIGHTLARITRLPWVADFRDPMAQDGYPADPRTWRAFERIEVARGPPGDAQHLFDANVRARTTGAVIRTGPSASSSSRMATTKRRSTGLHPAPPRANARPLVLLHSGIVYPSERDPTALFAALRALRDDGRIARGDLAAALSRAGARCADCINWPRVSA